MRKIATGILLVGAFGCNKPEGTGETTATEETTKVGEVALDSDSLAALKLSESLSPAVPESVAATGDGVEAVKAGDVALLTQEERKKSLEACYIRQKLREAKMNQESMAMQLCFIEAQKGMKAGGKYKMSFSQPGAALTQDMPPPPPPGDMPTGEMPTSDPTGAPTGGGQDMTLSIFLDNSVADKFTVFMCDSDKLTQKIVVSGAGDAGSKGSFKTSMEMEGMSAQIQGAFDNGVDVAGHQRAASQISFAMDMGGTKNYLRSSLKLDLVEDGVSVVKAATESSTSATDFSSSFREIGTALIGPNLGSALFQRTIEGVQATDPAMALVEQQVITTRSYFDNAGYVLSKEDSPNFADGAALAVADTDLPKLVPDSFKVEFEASDWDCSGTEDFAMDVESEGFKACTDRFASEFSMETCTDAEYGIGPTEEDATVVLEQREDSTTGPTLEAPPPQP